MMIAPKSHTAIHATARPSKSLRPVLVKLPLVAPIFILELVLHIFLLFHDNVPPACTFLRALPGDKLEFPKMLGAILAKPITIVPLCTLFALGLVGRPIGELAFTAAVHARLAGGALLDVRCIAFIFVADGAEFLAMKWGHGRERRR